MNASTLLPRFWLSCAIAPWLGLVAPIAQAQAERAVLRIACDGADLNAEVSINGEFKGECPLDIPVAGGTVSVRVVKKVGAARESVFEQTLRLVGGTVKRVDVVLGAPQLTPDGRRLEEDRMRREAAEAQRAADERRRVAEENARAALAAARRATAAARERIDPIATAMLTEDRASRGGRLPGCIDCPTGVRTKGVRLEVPTFSEPNLNGWVQRLHQDASRYLATAGAEFRPPAESRGWPCDGTEGTLRSLSGLLDLDDRPAAVQRAYREQYAAVSASLVEYVRELSLWPVQANCAAGKLDGPLEFWAFGNQVTGLDKHVTVAPRLVHVTATMAAGEPVGIVTKYQREPRSLTRFAQARSNEKQDYSELTTFRMRSALPAGEGHDVTLRMNFFENADVQKASPPPSLSVFVPQGRGRGAFVTFDGLRRSGEGRQKGDVLHGEYTIFAFSQPAGFLQPALVFPTTTYCYRDGNLVRESPCVVD